MFWMFTSLENFGLWLGDLLGRGIGKAGEQLGDKVPDARAIDTIKTARIISRDQAELYTIYQRLLKYRDEAKDICNALSRFAVGEAAIDAHSQTEEIAHQLCQKILIYDNTYANYEKLKEG